MAEVVLPELGENITKATISYWLVKEGDKIGEGQEIVEACTDKATFNVPSSNAGNVVKILVKEGDSVNVGQPLVIIE